jgi:Holliday junction resolvase RusA-like endonuclease
MGKIIASFSVDGRPIPCPRPRVVKGHAYNPPNYDAWRTECALVARGAMLGDEPVDCDVLLFLSVRLEDGRHGDLDNYIKAVNDAIEGVVFVNDKQVKRIAAKMSVNKDAPGVDVTVRTYKNCDVLET